MHGNGLAALEALRSLSGMPAAAVAAELALPADDAGIDAALAALRAGLRDADAAPDRIERVLGHMRTGATALPRASARRAALLVTLLARARVRQHHELGFDASTAAWLAGEDS